MTSDVVLTAALRNNLLSLQNTQKSIDATQFHLSTGKKVSSALDGPQAFFAAQSLNNRAGDLTRLLDSIGQSIQVIKAADNGVSALTTLVQQADSIAANAKDALAAGQVEAKAVGNKDLSGIQDLTTVSGITAGDALVFQITDEDGNAVNVGAYGAGNAAATASVTIAALDSIDDLVNKINDLHVADSINTTDATGEQAFEASLDSSGNLQIKTANGGDFNLVFQAAAAGNDATNLAFANAFGYGDVARVTALDGTGNNIVSFTALADVALRSFALYDNSGTTPEIASASTTLDNIEDEDANALFTGIDNANDQYVVSINGGTQQTIDLYDGANPISIQKFVDEINGNDALNTQIKAAYDDSTGVLTIKAIDKSVESIEIGVDGANEVDFGFGVHDNPNAGDGLVSVGGNQDVESIRLAASAADLAGLEKDYAKLLGQIDALVKDTGYRGTNLLNGDDLVTVFNEDRSNTLTTSGATFNSAGLGLTEADFSRTDTIDGTLDETHAALEAVRAFGSSLANDLSIIQARETFTNSLVNTLKEGADKLTLADQNEEGAKLLSLQTRQQLGVTSLSLAAQSQQSVLRLF